MENQQTHKSNQMMAKPVECQLEEKTRGKGTDWNIVEVGIVGGLAGTLNRGTATTFNIH